jgi:hypothetical protein
MSGPQEEALVEAQAQTIDRSDVAKGAGLAAVARLGALIEVVSQPAYTWMFGLAGYGVYVVLWAAVNILANLLDLALGQALQRIVPASSSREEQHGAVRFALVVGTGLGILAALAISLSAPMLAGSVASAPGDAAKLPQAIAIFAWSLPLWIFVETATAAARAMRAFGPEIRLRIFWEQVARLIFAAGFFFAGLGFEGLLFGHLASLGLTAWLSWKLLARYYDPALLLRAPLPPSLRAETLATGLAMLPPALARRAYNDLPPILLNAMIPGAGGATAAGLFGIARKIASIPLIVRQSFLMSWPRWLRRRRRSTGKRLRRYTVFDTYLAAARGAAGGLPHPDRRRFADRLCSGVGGGIAGTRHPARCARGRSGIGPGDADSRDDRPSRPSACQQPCRAGYLAGAGHLACPGYGRDRNGDCSVRGSGADRAAGDCRTILGRSGFAIRARLRAGTARRCWLYRPALGRWRIARAFRPAHPRAFALCTFLALLVARASLGLAAGGQAGAGRAGGQDCGCNRLPLRSCAA